MALGFVSLEVAAALQSHLAGIRDGVLRGAAFGIFFTTAFIASSFLTAFIGYLI